MTRKNLINCRGCEYPVVVLKKVVVANFKGKFQSHQIINDIPSKPTPWRKKQKRRLSTDSEGCLGNCRALSRSFSPPEKRLLLGVHAPTRLVEDQGFRVLYDIRGIFFPKCPSMVHSLNWDVFVTLRRASCLYPKSQKKKIVSVYWGYFGQIVFYLAIILGSRDAEKSWRDLPYCYVTH